LSEIPVFGRALPEEEAYPEGVEQQSESPLPYTLLAGQRYVAQSRPVGSYIDRSTFSDTPSLVVTGREEYYEIQFGHRIAYVRASDVDLVRVPGTEKTPSGHAAPPAGQ
jgi:hypothetical protein